MITLLAAIVSWSATCAAHAATVEVIVQDNDGNHLSNLTVLLYKIPPGSPPSETQLSDIRMMNRPVFGIRTGASGEAIFPGVPPGSYFADVQATTDKTLIVPSQNPFEPQPRLTIVKDDERISVPLTLWRGDLAVCRLAVNRGLVPRMGVHFLETARGVRLEAGIQPNGYAEQLLPPGRWEVSIDPPPGFLLTDLEFNGVSAPTATVIVDVVDGTQTDFVTWTYTALCRVSGTVSWDTGDIFPGSIEAKLLEAGSWKEAAAKRGGTRLDTVQAHWDSPSRYEILIPDGRWRIAPAGETILTSTPEFVEFDLAPGDEVSADFSVTHKEGTDGGGSAIIVQVESPDGAAIKGALVGIWPAGAAAAGNAPLKTALTEGDYSPRAAFSSLPAGNYVVAAGHEAFTEGQVEVRDYQPEKGRRVFKTVTLGRGAWIAARATDEKSVPAGGVELRVRRVDPPAVNLLNDAGLNRKRSNRRALTDSTGRLKIEGLDSGAYALTGALGRELPATHFVWIARGLAPPVETLEVTLGKDDHDEVALRLLPAASISGHVVCSDGGPLPDLLSIRVLPMVPDQEPETGSARATAGSEDAKKRGAAARDPNDSSGARAGSEGSGNMDAETRTPDSARPDSGKTDAGRSDAAKPASGKSDPGASDAPKPGSGKLDARTSDPAKRDSRKSDLGKSDPAKPEAGGSSASKTESGRSDSIKTASGASSSKESSRASAGNGGRAPETPGAEPRGNGKLDPDNPAEEQSLGQESADGNSEQREASLSKQAVLARNRIPLAGRDRDGFLAGPLKGGAYIVAVRPEQFDRWTFLPGTEDRTRAVPVGLEEGATMDLGAIEIDCGPTISLAPRIQSGAAPPDLREAKVTPVVSKLNLASNDPSLQSGLRTSSRAATTGKKPDPAASAGAVPSPSTPGSHAASPGDPTPLNPRIDPRATRIVLRGLPEGTISLAATLVDPFFVPEKVHADAAMLVLQRGREASVPIPLADVGGALEINWNGALAATVMGPLPAAPGSKPVVRAAERSADGTFQVGGLPAGAYRVELFSDLARMNRIQQWPRVDVAPLCRTRLPQP